MSSLKQLEQQKAELEIKITQSLEIAKKVELELERARARQIAVDKCSKEIRSLLENYGLRMEDVLPTPPVGSKALHKQEGQRDGLLSLFGVKPEVKYRYITDSLRLKKI